MMGRDTSREAHGLAPSMRVVSRVKAAASPNYADLDKPTYQRQRAVGDGLRAETDSEDLLDIPAFLRRQAD
jgi:3-deoxy-D-manno-octulosonic acid (KDO) 8-phosphate synthase